MYLLNGEYFITRYHYARHREGVVTHPELKQLVLQGHASPGDKASHIFLPWDLHIFYTSGAAHCERAGQP